MAFTSPTPTPNTTNTAGNEHKPAVRGKYHRNDNSPFQSARTLKVALLSAVVTAAIFFGLYFIFLSQNSDKIEEAFIGQGQSGNYNSRGSPEYLSVLHIRASDEDAALLSYSQDDVNTLTAASSELDDDAFLPEQISTGYLRPVTFSDARMRMTLTIHSLPAPQARHERSQMIMATNERALLVMTLGSSNTNGGMAYGTVYDLLAERGSRVAFACGCLSSRLLLDVILLIAAHVNDEEDIGSRVEFLPPHHRSDANVGDTAVPTTVHCALRVLGADAASMPGTLLPYDHPLLRPMFSIHAPFVQFEYIPGRKLKNLLLASPPTRSELFAVVENLIICPPHLARQPAVLLWGQALSRRANANALHRTTYYAKYVGTTPATQQAIQRSSHLVVLRQSYEGFSDHSATATDGALDILRVTEVNRPIKIDRSGVMSRLTSHDKQDDKGHRRPRTMVMETASRTVDGIPVRLGDVLILRAQTRFPENGMYTACDVTEDTVRLCSTTPPADAVEVQGGLGPPPVLPEICLTNRALLTRETCEAANGIWDRPCVRDDECPFFKPDQLVEHPRGGCMNSGYCEMPLGVEAVSYRRGSGKPLTRRNYSSSRIETPAFLGDEFEFEN